MLFKEDVREYLKSGGVYCPFCRSDEVDTLHMGVDAGYAWRKVECLECGKKWTDNYILHEIIEE